VPTGAVTKTNGFIYTSYLNGDSKNFLKPFTTFVQKISSEPLKLPAIFFRLSDGFRLTDFLPGRFFVVVVFFFALGILFSYTL
jgi:hypothetical protein